VSRTLKFYNMLTDSDTRYMEPVPYPSPEGTKIILEQLGVWGQPAEAFIAEFIDNRFIKQLNDEGFVKKALSRRNSRALTQGGLQSQPENISEENVS
jgi:hypothetical protein